MKILICLLLLTGSAIPSGKEQQMFARALLEFQHGQFTNSQKHFSMLIKEYPNSQKVQEFYYYENESLVKLSKTKGDLHDNRNVRKTKYPHGTLVVTFADAQAPSPDSATSKTVALAQEYLANPSYKKYREFFEWELLWSYTKKDSVKQVKIAEALTDAPQLNVRITSRYFLALYAYIAGDFHRAINLYQQIVSMDTTNNGQRARFYLLLADCYFRIGEVNTTLKYLGLAADSEKHLKYKPATDMANRWKKRIAQYLKEKPKAKKPTLVMVR